jgi:hypothetical protein
MQRATSQRPQGWGAEVKASPVACGVLHSITSEADKTSQPQMALNWMSSDIHTFTLSGLYNTCITLKTFKVPHSLAKLVRHSGGQNSLTHWGEIRNRGSLKTWFEKRFENMLFENVV